MKRGFVLLLIFFMLIASLSIASASFDVGNLSHSINKQYSPGGTIKGWINISLNNEPTNSIFNSSFGDSINLIDLLNENSGFQKTCIPTDCETDYSATSGATEKHFTLNAGESDIFGFKFSGNFNSISNFFINIASGVGESNSPQLQIDILNDGEIEWQSYKASGNFQYKDYGCFKPSDIKGQAELIQTEYCGKITLPISPNIKIGANIIENTGGNVNFVMSIHNYSTGDYASCEITASATGEISCIAKDTSDKNFKVEEERSFYVCIKTKNYEDNSKYKINYEENWPCGFAGSSSFDFEIFAKPGKYAPIGSFNLNNAELENYGSYLDIGSYIGYYISQRYGNDCSNDCIIPIKFISAMEQDIDISNIDISYQAGIATSIHNIYDITETPAKISSEFQKLYLDKGNFSVPNDFDDHSFQLNLADSEIFSEDITIEKVPQIISLTPNIIGAAYPVEFKVEVETFDSNASITKYTWDFFENGSVVKTTTDNSIFYTYNSIGTFQLKVTVTNSDQLSSSRTFEIIVETPIKVVNTLLAKKLRNLNYMEAQIDNFPLFHRTSLNSILSLTRIEKELAELQNKNASASSNEDYIDIMTHLLTLIVPRSVMESTSADSIPFYPEDIEIDLEILKKIGGGDYDEGDEDKYIDSILAWNLNNLDVKIDYSEYSAIYDDVTKKVLKTFDLRINKKNETYNPYFILLDIDNLKFKKDYAEKDESGYVYIVLTDPQTTITFSTTEDIDFVDLPLFISPGISELSIIKLSIFDEKEKLSKWTLFILILILLSIIGFVVYLILQTWYKKKYENYLFKNRNNLYNLISYIQNSKRRGLENKEIIAKLKKAGWKSEQITYVMRKYSGKRTGMFEIRIKNILRKSKKSDFNQKRIPKKRFS